MFCCTNCFTSNYVKDIITKNDQKGNCDFCKSQDVFIYEARALGVFISNVLSLYIVDNDKGKPALEQLENDFPSKIFSDKITQNLKEFLDAILENEPDTIKQILDQNIILNCKRSVDSQAKEIEVSWDNLVEEIKLTNRFHLTNKIDLEKLSILLNRNSKAIMKGYVFYRGRISTKEGFQKDQMCNPPRDKARPGRANPQGISYLYLASDVLTTLYETRATIYDYVCVGDFKLKENINVIDLRNSENYDPIYLADIEELEDFIIYLPFITKLETELSKPIRRHDNELDYLPTQYLCEFIKSLGFDGVQYKSSLNPKGYNLAIFTPDKFECIKSYVQEISEITFKHNKVE